jgi:hypothetical protein
MKINFQQNERRTSKEFSCSNEEATTREVVDKCEEIFIYEDITHLLGVFHIGK